MDHVLIRDAQRAESVSNPLSFRREENGSPPGKAQKQDGIKMRKLSPKIQRLKCSNRHPAEAPEDAKEQVWKGSVLYLVTDRQHLVCWYTLGCHGVERRLVASFHSFLTT